MKNFVFMIFFFPVLLLASFSIDMGTAISSKQLNSVYLTSSYSFFSNNRSLSLSLYLFKAQSGFGKTISSSLYWSFTQNWFAELNLNYMPELDYYQSFGASVSLGKSFGTSIVWAPSLLVGTTSHTIEFMVSQKMREAAISETTISPSLSITLFDITDLNLSITKNRQIVRVGKSQEDLLSLFQNNDLAKKIIMYNPALYSTTANFIDWSASVGVSQYIFYFWTIGLDYSHDVYLLPMDNNTILQDNVFSLSFNFYITEWFGANGTVSYYIDNMKTKQLSEQLSVSFYF